VCLAVLISGQIVILAFGYGFLVAVAYLQYLAPTDPVCELMSGYTGELTTLVTLIATVISFTSSLRSDAERQQAKLRSLRRDLSDAGQAAGKPYDASYFFVSYSYAQRPTCAHLNTTLPSARTA
jgi:hypothetical protein